MGIISCLFTLSQIIISILTLIQFCRDEPVQFRTKPRHSTACSHSESESNAISSQSRVRNEKRSIHLFFSITSSIASFWFTLCAICASVDNLFYSMPFIPKSYPKNSVMVGISAALCSYLGAL